MGIQAGVGMSHHRNPKVAGQEAAEKAPDGLVSGRGRREGAEGAEGVEWLR